MSSCPRSLDCEETGLGEVNYYNGGVNFALPQHLRHDDTTDSDGSSVDSDESREWADESAKRARRNCKKIQIAALAVLFLLLTIVGVAIGISKLTKCAAKSRQAGTEVGTGTTPFVDPKIVDAKEDLIPENTAQKESTVTKEEIHKPPQTQQDKVSPVDAGDMPLVEVTATQRDIVSPVDAGDMPLVEVTAGTNHGMVPKNQGKWKKYALAAAGAAVAAGAVCYGCKHSGLSVSTPSTTDVESLARICDVEPDTLIKTMGLDSFRSNRLWKAMGGPAAASGSAVSCDAAHAFAEIPDTVWEFADHLNFRDIVDKVKQAGPRSAEYMRKTSLFTPSQPYPAHEDRGAFKTNLNKELAATLSGIGGSCDEAGWTNCGPS